MAEPPAEVRRINWSEVFPFTQIFRTFRMAIHPSKLGLALAGVLLTLLLGWVLDLIWSERHRPMPGEVDAFWRVPDIDAWRKVARGQQFLRLSAVWAEISDAPPPDNLEQRYQQSPGDVVSDALERLKQRHRTRVAAAVGDAEVARVARDSNALHAAIVAARPRGVFASYVGFQLRTTHRAINSAVSLNWFGGVHEALTARGAGLDVGLERGELGALACLVLMFRADHWMVTEHPFFALLFGLGALAIWALIGAALCRTAALNVARDERLSPKAAVNFGRRKFLAFFSAPLLPIALIVVILLALFAGGLATAIPYVGEIIGGLGLGLALVGGFVAALVVIGLVAGGSLFYPTIAVEGSDSFDAMSRSYSYIYSRPWRAALYGAVAFIYGGICFVFVRFFLLVMLKATRFGMNIGLQWTDRPQTGTVGATKLDAMWASPTWEDLWRSVPPFGQHAAEPVGAFLIGIWLLLAVGLLWAFLISFYFSASTVIYLLLRREVDATDLEDVYLEEDEEPETSAPPPPMPPAPAPGGEVVTITPPPGAPARPAEPPPPPRAEAAPPPTPSPPPPPQDPPPPAAPGGGGA
jgi:hypothetical protein